MALWDPTDYSTLGFPAFHHLECAQVHAHRVGEAIQPSHPLWSPSPLPSVFPSFKVFSNESAVRIRWPKYWSFSFSIRPSKECSGLISLKTDWFDLFHRIIYFCFQSLKSEISWVIVSNMGNFCLRIRLNKHRSELEVNIQICKIVNYW